MSPLNLRRTVNAVAVLVSIPLLYHAYHQYLDSLSTAKQVIFIVPIAGFVLAGVLLAWPFVLATFEILIASAAFRVALQARACWHEPDLLSKQIRNAILLTAAASLVFWLEGLGMALLISIIAFCLLLVFAFLG